MRRKGVNVCGGLATLDEDHVRVLREIDGIVLRRAESCGAREVAFPPLVAVSDLKRIDYFENFPHLALAASPLRVEIESGALADERVRTADIPPSTLAGATHVLPSAACYPVYPYLQGTMVEGSERITTLQRCFRNELQYDGLARLWAFTMREIVAVGDRDDVTAFLAEQKEWIARFARAAGLDLTARFATDPFFEPGSSRAQMQRLFPVKEEFVHGHDLAVSSVNFHRNFFAERWDIRGASGDYAFTGCVAFGLERWLAALADRHGDDCAAMLAAIDAGERRSRLGASA